jgi:hypothetical protein
MVGPGGPGGSNSPANIWLAAMNVLIIKTATIPDTTINLSCFLIFSLPYLILCPPENKIKKAPDGIFLMPLGAELRNFYLQPIAHANPPE